ncbi:segregation/condensation protein A [Tomitella fengzijianii]|uniref:Segregation and condensation protein A n=1 Tax=Tomitella fengzijianii TaxID=2597660 RepID=A0A516X7X9_9ACTN|nr:segregation/condensation protein A [Tomitella fengzijianii]QDQ99169.1 segregation/condensation protein A [Tomitella fengzijianii]
MQAAADVSAQTASDQADTEEPRSADAGFTVRLQNFEGPFDLLLQLIGQHRMDVTEVALHVVTDDFIAYTKQLGAQMGLDQTTEFLVIASTLLDLKAARLLPSGEVEDEADLELLEIRDLLFARILQYRAYKQVAELFRELEAAALQRYPAAVPLEERFTDLLPEVRIGAGPERLAEIAAYAMRPKEVPSVGLDHLHAPRVSVQEHAQRIVELLRRRGADAPATFTELVDECGTRLEIVARFLGLLELYRQRTVTFDQPEPLGDLLVEWTGEGDAEDIDDEEYA